MDEDEGEIMRIPAAGGGHLVVGWRRGRITIGGYELRVREAATLEMAVDEAVAYARTWRDGNGA